MSDPNDDDMDKPITKREALDVFLTKREVLELFPTKKEMRELFATFLDALMIRIDQRFSQQDARIQTLFKNAESRLTREMREQFGAIDQDHLDDLTKFEEKYEDLPNRVSKLESAVFVPPPAKRQRRR